MLPCAYKSLLGIDCPLCGGQRSFLLLIKGDIAGSFQLFPPLVPVLLCGLLFAIHLLSKKTITARQMKTFAAITLVIVLATYLFRLVTGRLP